MPKKKPMNKPPSQVIALYDYDPLKDEVHDQNVPAYTAPDVNVQFSFERGEKFEVISKTLDWWLTCKSLKSGNEGYVPSVYLAPLCNEVEEGCNGKANGTADKEKFIPCVDKKYFNLKYFPNAPESKQKKPCPEKKANIFSILSFSWMNNIIFTGFKRPLTDGDLWELDPQNQASKLLAIFDKEWEKEMTKMKTSPLIEEKISKKSKKNEKKDSLEEKEILMTETGSNKDETENEAVKRHKYKPSVSKALIRSFGLTYLFAAFFKLIHDSLLFVSPYLLGKLISFMQSDTEETKWGYIYACLLLTTVTCQSLVLHQYFHRVYIVALRCRSVIFAAVYKKMLKLSVNGRRDFTVGGMVNLMSVDAQKCHDLLGYLNLLWSGPFQIIISLGFLYNLMGWSIIAGFVVLLLLMPLNIWVSSIEKKLHAKQMVHKDSRSKIMNEILAGIKVLKLYAWEDSFIAKVMGFRKLELTQLRKAMILKANYSFTLSCTPFFVSVATFAVYVLTGNELTAQKAFVAVSLFNIIRFPLFILPMVISNIMQYTISVKRISKFLKGDELNLTDVKRLDSSVETPNAIEIKDATFTWTNPEKPVLSNIDLVIPKGSLTAVVGSVGCGKSSLLSSVLGDINKVNGEVILQGQIAYVAQQAWIQNATVRDNVLFNKNYIQRKYNDILSACSLQADLEVLPMGDVTEIGEKGINLSGGQKQRVSLARAVYNNADVYLMDDPLSAVDAHVGKHIFDHVIGSAGLLKNKTRLLVTHQLSFLQHVDQIIVLKDNQISEIGSYDDLVSNDGDFAEFLKTHLNDKGDGNKDEDKSDNDKEDLKTRVERSCSKINKQSDELQLPEVEFRGVESDNELLDVSKRDLHASVYSLFDNLDGMPSEDIAVQEMLDEHDEITKRNAGNVGNIIKEETSETGRVKRTVFMIYASSIGYILTLFMVLFGFCGEAFLIGSRIWLADWSVQVNITSSERDFYLGVYGGLGISQGVCILFNGYFLAFGAVHASKTLHNGLLKNVLRCPMLFFETTPMGRIVNRFSKDINIIDELIPQNTKSFITTFTSMIGTIFVISYSTPLFLAVLVPIAAVYFLTQRYYVASSRQLKRIESVKRSPIYNHFFESIYGASTIRAFEKNSGFVKENEARIDENQAAYYPAVSSNRWLAMRLELCGNLITFFAALFCIVQRYSISGGMAGLSISYSLQVTQTLNWLVRMTSELETNIISVERVKEYIDLPTEAAAIVPDSRPNKDWPQNGTVEFNSFSVRYRPGLDLVLRGIDYQVSPCEKVGIVGRTGAGKSSMALALFRIIESAAGKIFIDGIDISKIGLKDLRSKLTIIPQDPVLFSGSLRFNLDPFGQFTDADLWKVLEVAHLKTLASKFDEGLMYEVSEGGDNLSVGERQLICLARALLRKTKILLLDEATAAVDLETDSLIQQTIRTEFKDSTILTIAHRLNTIMDYDRILVLSNGEVAEFDAPKNLLAQKTGLFYSMAKDSGLVSSD